MSIEADTTSMVSLDLVVSEADETGVEFWLLKMESMDWSEVKINFLASTRDDV